MKDVKSLSLKFNLDIYKAKVLCVACVNIYLSHNVNLYANKIHCVMTDYIRYFTLYTNKWRDVYMSVFSSIFPFISSVSHVDVVVMNENLIIDFTYDSTRFSTCFSIGNSCKMCAIYIYTTILLYARLIRPEWNDVLNDFSLMFIFW